MREGLEVGTDQESLLLFWNLESGGGERKYAFLGRPAVGSTLGILGMELQCYPPNPH